MMKRHGLWRFSAGLVCISVALVASELPEAEWSVLPELPEALGVAGPFAGVHGNALIVAGGANFPSPVWDNDKVWHDRIYVLLWERDADRGYTYRWQDGDFRLPKPMAYGASVSTPRGVLCMGGNDGKTVFRDVFLLQWDAAEKTVRRVPLPPLPEPCCYTYAASIDDTVYVAGGTQGLGLDTAMSNVWAFDLGTKDAKAAWETLPPWPGPARAFNLTVAQKYGRTPCLYVFSGRRADEDATGGVEFLRDGYRFDTQRGRWQTCADAPCCQMAGVVAPVGDRHIAVVGGADGTLFFRGDELKDLHPGFPRQPYLYDTLTDQWTPSGELPLNHVTTVAVPWPPEGQDAYVIPSGEIRPRVRTPLIHLVKYRAR